MLVGSRVRLRALEAGDYDLLHRWLNDANVMQFWGRPGNTQSLAEITGDEERNAKRGNSRKYIIETLEQNEAIGQIDYYDLDLVSRNCWTSIMIGNPDYWGGGYGTDAMRVLLRYLFGQLDVHRVVLTTLETNVRAQRSYAKNGFVQEGVLRDWMFFDGAYQAGIIMSVLDEDFRRTEEQSTSSR
jgi:RimJ/RimL family protein N-acetyltransferase